MTGPITRVQTGTNAHLIAIAQALYPMNGAVLDMTPGTEEGFWKEHRPDGLVLLAGGDFRRVDHLYAPGWNHVVFDPPYVAKGGHATSTIDEMNTRYGMLDVEKNPELQWSRQIVPGIGEAHRLLADKGMLWLKIADYVTSGRTHWFTKRALDLFTATGWFELVDEFILAGHPGPQPTTTRCKTCKGLGVTGDLNLCTRCAGHGEIARRQVHARNAHSVLMIAAKR